MKDVGFGWQGAIQITSDYFRYYNLSRPNNDIAWCYNESKSVYGLEPYRIAERFLLDKQLFFTDEEPIPSFPPIRGRLTNSIKVSIVKNSNTINLELTVDLSAFESQKVLIAYFHCKIPEISVDDLILLKECKWFKSSSDSGSFKVKSDKLGEMDSISDLQFQVLRSSGIHSIEQKSWPVFDYVQLTDVGPSVGRGPNLSKPLDLQEHWGLLVGDEGYRLIDYKQSNYKEHLESDETRFRGRFVFLYQFSPTSCLIFYDKNIRSKRSAWASYYQENIADIPDLVKYIGFETDVPGLTDGIPIMVEICLIRYVELKRIDELMGSTYLLEPINALLRVFGQTRLEKAVAKLHRLDLYQDSSLWIIGGKYTDLLFEYESLRRRIEKSTLHRNSVVSEIRSLSVSVVSLIVAAFALAVGLEWIG